ncbi:hypothetical protein [Salinibacterium sp. ZJ450]|uniref:hypothetical protein n=1 Tax=Salinibacterium sp. ZJ450 TaxID=2708338 RepID=UPI001420591F|nr:hypothetical protein [Salinibacterium sp. ZJ450]
MASVDDDDVPTADARVLQPEQPEGPLQAYLPNLDKISRSSFRKGTVSRRRINRALGTLGLVIVVIALLILGSTF